MRIKGSTQKAEHYWIMLPSQHKYMKKAGQRCREGGEEHMMRKKEMGVRYYCHEGYAVPLKSGDDNNEWCAFLYSI